MTKPEVDDVVFEPGTSEEVLEGLHEDEVLTARQAARLLKISHDLLYESAGRGDIPHRRLGRRMLFSRVALLAWLRSSADPDARRTRRQGSRGLRLQPNRDAASG